MGTSVYIALAASVGLVAATALIDHFFRLADRIGPRTRWTLIAAAALAIPVFLRLFLYYRIIAGDLIEGVQIIESGLFYMVGLDMADGVYFRGFPFVYASFLNFIHYGFLTRLGAIDFSILPFVSVSLSFFAIVATYGLTRRLFDRRMALLAAFLMGMSFWASWMFLRVFAVIDPFMYTFAYWAFIAAMDRDNRFLYFSAGLMVGIGFLLRPLPPLPLAVMLFVLRYRRPAARGRTFGWVALGFLAALWPLFHDIVFINPGWIIEFLGTMVVKGATGAPPLLTMHHRIIQSTLPMLFLAHALPLFIGGVCMLAGKWRRGLKFTEGEGFLSIWGWAVFLFMTIGISYLDEGILGARLRPGRHYSMLFPAPYIFAAYFLVNWRVSLRALRALSRWANRYLVNYATVAILICGAIVLLAGKARDRQLRGDARARAPMPHNSVVISNFPVSRLHSTVADFHVRPTWAEFMSGYADPEAWKGAKALGGYYKYPYIYYETIITRGGGVAEHEFHGNRVMNHLAFGSFPVAPYSDLSAYGTIMPGSERKLFLAVMGARGVNEHRFMARIAIWYHAPVAGYDFIEYVKKYNPRGLTEVMRDEQLDTAYFEVDIPRTAYSRARFLFRSLPLDPEPGALPVSQGHIYRSALGYGIGHNLSDFWAFTYEPESENDGMFVTEFANEFRIDAVGGWLFAGVELELDLVLDYSDFGDPTVCISSAGGERCIPLRRPPPEVPEGRVRLEAGEFRVLRPYRRYGHRKGEAEKDYYFDFQSVSVRTGGGLIRVRLEPGSGWILVRDVALRPVAEPRRVKGGRLLGVKQ